MLAQGVGDGVLSEVSMDEDSNFTESQIERFKSDPVFYQKFVKAVEEVVNGNFPLVCTVSLELTFRLLTLTNRP